ncbi:MAG: hypothetical protein JW814_02505 [Candidatus Krumholzibacteriota bacterium]|nr:hypothetical protein [Candidatus Krumholzibacteriota bacterium]
MPAGVENELTGGGGFFSNLGALGETYSAFVRVRRNFIIDYIVRSRLMSTLMSEKFDLMTVYGVRSEEEVREKLMRATIVIVRDEGVLEIGVESENPVMARDMVDAYIGYIDSILVSMSVASAGSTRKYLEDEVARRRGKIAVIDSSIQDFSDRHGIFAIQQQARAAFLVMAGISARENLLEIERNILERSMKDNFPEMKMLDLELEKIEEQLKNMMEGGEASVLFPPLKEFPEIASGYMSLVSDRMIQEFALAFIMLKLEDARVSESSDASVIRIIDPPYIPGVRSWPKRKQIVIVFTLASFFWALFSILLYEQIKAGLFRGWKEGMSKEKGEENKRTGHFSSDGGLPAGDGREKRLED